MLGNGRQLTKLIYADVSKQSIESVHQIGRGQLTNPAHAQSTHAGGAVGKEDYVVVYH